MTIDPEQWCRDLVRRLSADNIIKRVGGIYSADGTILHCELVINGGTVPFLVRFAISNEGYLLSPSVRPESDYNYNKYGPRKYGQRTYSPLKVEYYSSIYLVQNLSLKPSIEDFRDEIVKIRKIWLNRDQIPQIEQIR